MVERWMRQNCSGSNSSVKDLIDLLIRLSSCRVKTGLSFAGSGCRRGGRFSPIRPHFEEDFKVLLIPSVTVIFPIMCATFGHIPDDWELSISSI
jgi:hypothetical protein